VHSTNYANTFIEVAEDCGTEVGVVPPERRERTLARLQYDLVSGRPYAHTSDEILFAVFAEKNGIPERQREPRRAEFFSKGQPCLRSSPLAKNYGWGFHFDADSRVAIYARESAEYARLLADASLKHLKAMRSSR